jgi:sec-independent protein translocase protein TatA
MFGIGITELIIIMAIILIIFCAGKLPEIGTGVGKAIKNFKGETLKNGHRYPENTETFFREYAMKNFTFRHFLPLAGGVIGLRVHTMPTFTQDAEKVQELLCVKVIRERSAFIILVVLLLAAQVFFVSTVAAEEGCVDAKTVERLERLIK